MIVGCGGKGSTDAPPTPVVAQIDVSPVSATVEVGATIQMSATAKTSAGATLPRTFTWSAAPITTVSINASGLVTGVAPGAATVSAAADGRTGSATITVVVPAVAEISVALGASTLVVGRSTQATATLRSASGAVLSGRTVQWTSANPAVATVSASGIVQAISAGQTTITGTSEGKSAQAPLSVVPPPVATVSVSLSATSLFVGQSALGVAVARDSSGASLVGRSVAWATSAPSVATVSSTGRVVALAPGQATVTATSEGRSGSQTLTVAAPPADNRAAVLASMHTQLAPYVSTSLQAMRDGLPRNPGATAYYEAKIALLSNPTLASDVVAQQWNVSSTLRSLDSRQLPVVLIFAQAAMRTEAAAHVGSAQLALEGIERFLGLPFPFGDMRVWYGFVIGSSGGTGSLFMEDQGTYEARTPATRLPYEAIVTHEIAHSYVGNESLTQFIELFVYNTLRTGSTDVATWPHTRAFVPGNPANTGVQALLDVYQVLGADAMARAYRTVIPLRPGFGVPLCDACRQAFVDQAPAASRVLVAGLMSRVTT